MPTSCMRTYVLRTYSHSPRKVAIKAKNNKTKAHFASSSYAPNTEKSEQKACSFLDHYAFSKSMLMSSNRHPTQFPTRDQELGTIFFLRNISI